MTPVGAHTAPRATVEATNFAEETSLPIPRRSQDRVAQSFLSFIATEVQMGCFCQLFNPGASEDAKASHRERLTTRLGHIERHLTDHHYMLGEHFSLADAYVYVVLNWSRAAGIDLSPFPHVLTLRKRVRARPAVQDALKTEGLAG